MKSLAALIRETGTSLPYATSRPLEIVEVDLAPPQAGEVLVKIEAAGICHSDLSVLNGSRPRPLPIIGGHESAGVVIGLGADVRDLKIGDHVTTVFLPSCGTCHECTSGIPAYCSVGATSNARGEMINGGSRISLDGKTVNHYNGATKEFKKIDKDIVRISEEKAGLEYEPMSIEKPEMETE